VVDEIGIHIQSHDQRNEWVGIQLDGRGFWDVLPSLKYPSIGRCPSLAR
jgi:hypothetical protein